MTLEELRVLRRADEKLLYPAMSEVFDLAEAMLMLGDMLDPSVFMGAQDGLWHCKPDRLWELNNPRERDPNEGIGNTPAEAIRAARTPPEPAPITNRS